MTVASAGPGEDGNYSNELPAESLVPWVEAARDAGVYVVLDLQPGRADFVTQARAYESLLLYPNVGLALDPEWRLAPDQVPLRQIGSVHVDEVNAVADYFAGLTRANRLPQKALVLHQFMHRMIDGRELVNTSHEELAVLIHADGQGSQGAKAGTWASLHEGAPASPGDGGTFSTRTSRCSTRRRPTRPCPRRSSSAISDERVAQTLAGWLGRTAT